MLRNNGWAGHPTFTHVPYTKSNTDDDRVSRFVRAAGTYWHCMVEKDMGLEMILRDIAIMSDEYLLGIRNIYMDALPNHYCAALLYLLYGDDSATI
jgi:hypothetical protein